MQHIQTMVNKQKGHTKTTNTHTKHNNQTQAQIHTQITNNIDKHNHTYSTSKQQLHTCNGRNKHGT